MRSASKVLVCGVSLLCLDVASAHHAFAPVYDGGRTVTVAGVVTAFRLVNPHAQMSVDVTDDAGKVVTWNVEFDGRLNLTNGGWNDDTITIGERLSVTGNPTHTGSSRIFFVSLQRTDGTALLRPAIARIQALEEQRRQRRQPAARP
jgi:Family of unknown function (DUF6152)